MNLLLVFAIVFVVLGILAALKMKLPAKDDSLAFQPQDALFSPAERSFLGVLEQAVGGRYRVFGKVRLGDIVKPAKGLSKSKGTTALNKIRQKHVDFVICSAADLSLVGVVELDDKSHGRADRAERDDFLDKALVSAKVPVVHFPAKKGYVVQEVRARLAEGLKLAVAPVAVSAAREETPAVKPEAPVVAPQVAAAALVCQKCAAAMVKRQAKNGPHAGEWFWACSTFPKCRQVLAVADS